MKRFLYSLMIGMAACLASCKEDLPDPDTSAFADEITTTPTPLDRWLEKNYREPYNIDFKWRYDMKETDLDYYTTPADYTSSILMAHLVKYLCIDSYTIAAGIRFTRNYFPKMFLLLGDWEYNPMGTMLLGTAEGGKKIILTGVNNVRRFVSSPDNLNYYYIKTIHHEFTHILNQIVEYPDSFKTICGADYQGDNWSVVDDHGTGNEHDWNYLLGFITPYASHSDTEDFAEMLSTYITNTPAFWESCLTRAGDAGRAKINAKLDIVRSYMKTNFDIDIDTLRDVILARQEDIRLGKVDLLDLTL